MADFKEYGDRETLGQWCDCSFCERFPAIAKLRRLWHQSPRRNSRTLLNAVCWELASLEAELDGRPVDSLIYKAYAYAVVCREAA